MKIKNKGKVFPSPSSASATSSAVVNGERDFFYILKLLPAAILALASVLPFEDREVLAYMITRSMKTTTTPSPSSLVHDSKRKPPKKQHQQPNTNISNHNHTHKTTPVFDCDCFDCYTNYWFKWDSSPNRELIHQVIEAFEEHLSNGERIIKNGRGKKKSGRRLGDKAPDFDISGPSKMLSELQPTVLETEHKPFDVSVSVSPNDDVSPANSPKKTADGVAEVEELDEEATPAGESSGVVLLSAPVVGHRGLARKVLPDVLGLLNSRLWGLLGSNV
ncbi:hypothetical protein K2173_006680 [Erythroxylum novogranatense]|uniref:Uncharacterized protein n=1 Tax=Erythroxylum novogranatense TaxID=1862640 RepID=A0AAV8SXM8_9ROSI|nr:hypothetical protein K2173_006680 [Erythroxylum novogranatense]